MAVLSVLGLHLASFRIIGERGIFDDTSSNAEGDPSGPGHSPFALALITCALERDNFRPLDDDRPSRASDVRPLAHSSSSLPGLSPTRRENDVETIKLSC